MNILTRVAGNLVPRTRRRLEPDEFLALSVELEDGRLLPMEIRNVMAEVIGDETEVLVEGWLFPLTGVAVASHLTFMGQRHRSRITNRPSARNGSMTVYQRFIFNFTPE